MVTGMEEQELIHHLSGLKDTELLYERGIYPESTYIFKHALTREVVYDSILTAKKKQLHERIGNAIAQIHREDIIEHYGVLAEHFVESTTMRKELVMQSWRPKGPRKQPHITTPLIMATKGWPVLNDCLNRKQSQKELIDARVTLGLYYNQMSYLAESQ